MRISAKTVLNKAGLLKRVDRATQLAVVHLKKEIESGSRPYVPYLNGVLRGSAAASVDTLDPYLVYRTPYARYLYYGKLMVSPSTGSSWAKQDEIKVLTDTDLHYSTAGTGPQWFEKWKAANGDAAVREVAEHWAKKFNGGGGK